MRRDGLPLFDWQPAECLVVAFPLDRQIGKIRHTANQLLSKRTERHADYYRGQVTDAIMNRLERAGVPEDQWNEQIGAFWSAVEAEAARLVHTGRRPGGGDAA